MINDIVQVNFPEYATLLQADVNLNDMGEQTITTQIKIDGEITPDFSYNWIVMFRGEVYIHAIREPQAAKDNTSLNSVIDLTFEHWAIYQLKRFYFVEMTSTESGTAIPDRFIASLSLNLNDFVAALAKVLKYWYGSSITVDFNPDYAYAPEPITVEISYSYIWDVLQQLYELYGVRWFIKTVGSQRVIKIGYPATELSHIFEYGFQGGLLTIERQVQSTDIKNVILGRGGENNLPYRYFKNIDPDNDSFPADPDWIPELANIYFANLHGKTFRDYVKGWKTNPNRQLTYKDSDGKTQNLTVETYDSEYAAENFAYKLGHEDELFNPVEYVKDDKSIAKYGEFWSGLDNIEDIYPTIQGRTVAPYGRIDQTVDIEQITSDDVEKTVYDNSKELTIEEFSQTIQCSAGQTAEFHVSSKWFNVPDGYTANLIPVQPSVTATAHKKSMIGFPPVVQGEKTETIKDSYLEYEDAVYHIYKSGADQQEVTGINMTAGDYYIVADISVKLTYPVVSPSYADVTVSVPRLKLTCREIGSEEEEQWGQRFNIWVKNIWQTNKKAGESDATYAERVWTPILGDRIGNEAKVVFSSGMLSMSEDYEFTIVTMPEHDESKVLTDSDGTEYTSHWKLTLAKSDADLESIGLYVPSTMRQGHPGDFFFFIGIDMPHQYVLWAEEELDNYKMDVLAEYANIKPAWVIGLDKVRINNRLEEETDTLIQQLAVGARINLRDKRFMLNDEGQPIAYDTFYIQSLSFSYKAPTTNSPALYPDVEIVLSDKPSTVTSPVSQIQGSIETLSRAVGGLSNIEAQIRAICDTLYLRKDGVDELSASPTRWLGTVTGSNFRRGLIDGRDWGIYRDANGKAVIEADFAILRGGLQASTYIINQVESQGGKIYESAAAIECTNVIETDEGYVCFFNQQGGSVSNLFKVDDVAMSQTFDYENKEAKGYRRRVIATDVDSITLSKTEVYGVGIPQIGDVIVHHGNYTDKNRQYIIVRDVIGGGYERMLSGLDSVLADGDEYYFAGRVNGDSERWFIGAPDGQYAEYYKGRLSLAGTLTVNSKYEDADGNIRPLGDFLQLPDNDDYLKRALLQSTTVSGGLVLSSLIQLGYTDVDTGVFAVWSGINGIYSSEANGGGIAAWYGGDMIDMADYYEWDENTWKWILKSGVTSVPERIATAIDRMDGSGYRAGGALWWGTDGILHADPLSFVIGEQSVKGLLKAFQIVLTPSTTVVIDYIIPRAPFQNLTILDSLRIGDALLEYDSENKALRVISATDSSQGMNFYASGGVSAIGAESSSGDIPSTPTTISWEDITDKPTTLSGYGITDALPATSAISSIAITRTNLNIASLTWNGTLYVTITLADGTAVSGNVTLPLAQSDKEIGGVILAGTSGLMSAAQVKALESLDGVADMVKHDSTTDTTVLSGTNVSISSNGTATISATATTISSGSVTISTGGVSISGGGITAAMNAAISILTSVPSATFGTTNAYLTFTQTGSASYQAELNCPLIVNGSPVLTEATLPALQYHLEAYVRNDPGISGSVLGLLTDGEEKELPSGCSLRFFRLIRSNSKHQSADNDHHRMRRWICPFNAVEREEMMPLTAVVYYPSVNKYKTPAAVAATTTGTPATLAYDLFKTFNGAVRITRSGYAERISLGNGNKAKVCDTSSRTLRASAQYGVALIRDGVQVSNIAPFRLVMELMPSESGALTQCTPMLYLTI